MIVLGIETSCDETAAAIVKDGCNVISNIIASQIQLHQDTGGVVPEVAAREHVLKIIPVVESALSRAFLTLDNIDLIGVTQGPGLLSSLLIGTTAASVLGSVANIPVISVNHIAGHIYGNWLGMNRKIEFPVLTLTVSGGHNELVLLRNHFDFQVLGKTRDDAAGEAFDKVARMLGLGYPGGQKVAHAAAEGDMTRYKFPRAWLSNSYDFSFSGLKTAVWRCLNELSYTEKNKKTICDIAASFQEAVVHVLATKLIMATREFCPREVHIAGGVSANLRLREVLQQRLSSDVIFRHPESLLYCTDNAAMIASAAYFKYVSQEKKSRVRMIVPNLEIALEE